MDPHYYAGDDDRDLGIVDETCGDPNCHAGPLDDCDPACGCDHCRTHRDQPADTEAA